MRQRLDFIDAHRGLAVVLMLWMHTADAWLRPDLKHGIGWAWVRSVGGLAAPIFLLLAGLSVGLGWTSPAGNGSRREELARGLQLVVLGYVLRLQMWMLDAGGYHHLSCWAAALPLAAAYLAAYRGLSAWARSAKEAWWLAAAAMFSLAVGLWSVSILIPDRLLPLLRVDVLQAIGGSLVCLCLLRDRLSRRPALGLALAALVAALTPWLQSWVPGPLPAPIAGYLAAWDAAPGQLAPTLFPLFPWLAYAFVGATIGLHLANARRREGSATNAALRLAAFGVLLALLTCEALRPARAVLIAWPGLTQPARVAYRVGVSLALGGLAVGLSQPRVPLRGSLLALGRASLFAYWIHLELAFGGIARPFAHKLSWSAWRIGFVTLFVVMAAAAPLWLRLRARLLPPAVPRPRADEPEPEPAALSRA